VVESVDMDSKSSEDKLRELYKRASGTLMSLTEEEEALWADSPPPEEPVLEEGNDAKGA